MAYSKVSMKPVVAIVFFFPVVTYAAISCDRLIILVILTSDILLITCLLTTYSTLTNQNEVFHRAV